MLEAVLFDWGDTLMDFAYDPELVAAGQRAGLRAIGADGLAESDALTEHFRENYEPLFWAPGTIEEIEYPGLVVRLLGDFDISVDDEQLGRFLQAEHAAWEPARRLGRDTHALLESLRDLGLKLGLVSNAFDPGWLLRGDLDRMRLSQRLDVAVFSSEVGKRKPHPEIFERALGSLEVEPAQALFVGDRLYEDVRGAGELGMTTVQALWFRADEHPDGGEPDHRAFTMMDVLNVARRLVSG
jgi:putative hydrolase of the HAD superfamily